MARRSTAGSGIGEVVKWGGIALILLFVVPRLFAAIRTNNATLARSSNPGTAANAQAARAVNTAGSLANNALANALNQLLKQPSNAAKGSSPSGGNAPGLSAGSRISERDPLLTFLQAGGITPISDIYARGDYVRTPQNIDFMPWEKENVPPPTIDYGDTRSSDLSFLTGTTPTFPTLADPGIWVGDYSGQRDYSPLAPSDYSVTLEPWVGDYVGYGNFSALAPDLSSVWIEPWVGDYSGSHDYSDLVSFDVLPPDDGYSDGYSDFGYSDYSDYSDSGYYDGYYFDDSGWSY